MKQTDLQQTPSPGLYPLLEIQLNGNLAYDRILNAVSQDYKVPYKLTSVDIEFDKGAHYGKLLMFLLGSQEENDKALEYFKRKKINSTIKGYA